MKTAISLPEVLFRRAERTARTYKRRIAGKLGLEGESGIVQHFLSWLTDPATCPHTELEGVLRQSQPPPPPTSWTPPPETIEAE
jgi:hypothetical protein